MSSRRALLLVAVLGLFSARDAVAASRAWLGGGIGVQFGDVDYVEVSPVVGMDFNDRFSGGVGATYRYREDGRYLDDFNATDYGASLFARYRVAPPVFLQGEVEYLSYEFRDLDGSDRRDDFTSVLAGPGISQPLGDRAWFHAAVLYNFSYDSNRYGAPYDDPWVYRVGVSFGF